MQAVRVRFCSGLVVIALATASFASSAQQALPALLCGKHETLFGMKVPENQNLGGTGIIEPESANVMRLPYIELMGALLSLDSEALPDFFSDFDSVSGAADDFGAPDIYPKPQNDLGMIDFRAVYVATAPQDKLFRFIKHFNHAPVKDAGGHPIWVWKELQAPGYRDGTFYAGVTLDHRLVVANSEAGLLSVLNAVEPAGRATCTGPVVASMQSASYWVYRNNKVRDAAVNSMVPLTSNPLITAISLVHHSGRHVGELRLYVADNDKASANLFDKDAATLFARDPTGYVATLPDVSTPDAPYQWLGMIGMFGFIVYV